MVHYKLTYLDGRGLGEVPRQIFALSTQTYEDVRIPYPEWPERKKTLKTAFGQVPLLEFDGKSLNQSQSINRYLARQFGLAGKDAFEEAQVDSVADQMKDYINETQPFRAVFLGMAEGDVSKLHKDVLVPAVDKNFGLFTKVLKNSKSGFVVGDSLTWADLLLAQMTNDMNSWVPGVLDAFPEANAHQKKIESLPKLKEWIEKRPVTPF